MTRSERAISYFKDGFNCTQAVLAAFAPDFNLPERTALMIASPFGSGMGRTQNVCGAVSGAIMAIGLRYGKGSREEDDRREDAYARTARFLELFKAAHGSINCRDLIGVDLSTPESRARAHEDGLFERLCAGYVRGAVDILEREMGSGGR